MIFAILIILLLVLLLFKKQLNNFQLINGIIIIACCLFFSKKKKELLEINYLPHIKCNNDCKIFDITDLLKENKLNDENTYDLLKNRLKNFDNKLESDNFLAVDILITGKLNIHKIIYETEFDRTDMEFRNKYETFINGKNKTAYELYKFCEKNINFFRKNDKKYKTSKIVEEYDLKYSNIHNNINNFSTHQENLIFCNDSTISSNNSPISSINNMNNINILYKKDSNNNITFYDKYNNIELDQNGIAKKYIFTDISKLQKQYTLSFRYKNNIQYKKWSYTYQLIRMFRYLRSYPAYSWKKNPYYDINLIHVMDEYRNNWQMRDENRMYTNNELKTDAKKQREVGDWRHNNGRSKHDKHNSYAWHYGNRRIKNNLIFFWNNTNTYDAKEWGGRRSCRPDVGLIYDHQHNIRERIYKGCADRNKQYPNSCKTITKNDINSNAKPADEVTVNYYNNNETRQNNKMHTIDYKFEFVKNDQNNPVRMDINKISHLIFLYENNLLRFSGKDNPKNFETPIFGWKYFVAIQNYSRRRKRWAHISMQKQRGIQNTHPVYLIHKHTILNGHIVRKYPNNKILKNDKNEIYKDLILWGKDSEKKLENINKKQNTINKNISKILKKFSLQTNTKIKENLKKDLTSKKFNTEIHNIIQYDDFKNRILQILKNSESNSINTIYVSKITPRDANQIKTYIILKNVNIDEFKK